MTYFSWLVIAFLLYGWLAFGMGAIFMGWAMWSYQRGLAVPPVTPDPDPNRDEFQEAMLGAIMDSPVA